MALSRLPRARGVLFAWIALVGPAALAAGFFGCSDTEVEPLRENDAGTIKRDGAAIDGFLDGNFSEDDASEDPPSCPKYCDIVLSNCVGPYAQYATHADCMAFCDHLPSGTAGDKDTATLGCRLYWAGNPARTDPSGSCFAAGPFGGGVCGDRCLAFCTTALSACSPDGGTAAYTSQPECADACELYTYRDAGPEGGGGEGPTGPATGDSLNCRLYHLREAVVNPPVGCPKLRPGSTTCKQ